jgi:hypothetical protein
MSCLLFNELVKQTCKEKEITAAFLPWMELLA